MPKAKTRNNLKKTSKLRNNLKKSSKSKTINNKNKLNNPKPAFQVYNVGSTETIVSDNNKSSKSSVEWKGNYDGELANIHVSVNNNGRNENMDIKLNNQDLMHLLGQPVVQEPIEDRLMNDFLRNRRPIMPMYITNQEEKQNMPLFLTNQEYEPILIEEPMIKKVNPKNKKK